MLYDAGIDIEERKGKLSTYGSLRKPKFKYILTKSVSRFSRNTEIITIIRDLKSKGVFIIFDDINKSTESTEDTMLLEFLQSMAQEESRNKSQIIKWGKKRNAESGHISLQAKTYGYESNKEENTLRIILQEAEIVKKIFSLAEDGLGVRRIKKLLIQENILNDKGKEFSETHLLYMLRNPKYCGLNIRNRWEKVDLYNSNIQTEKPKEEWIIQETDKIDKIIEMEQFKKVQELIENRAIAKKGVYLGKGEFSRKILCSCGSFYTRNKETYTSGITRVFYNCSNKKKNGVKACASRNIGSIELEEHIELFRKTEYESWTNKVKQTMIEILESKKNDIIKNKDNNNILEIKATQENIKINENKLSILVESMLDNSTQTLQKVYNTKIKEIETKLKKLESKLKVLERTEDATSDIIKNVDIFTQSIKSVVVNKNMTREEFLEEIVFIKVKEDSLHFITKNYKTLESMLEIVNGDLEKLGIINKKTLE